MYMYVGSMYPAWLSEILRYVILTKMVIHSKSFEIRDFDQKYVDCMWGAFVHVCVCVYVCIWIVGQNVECMWGTCVCVCACAYVYVYVYGL